MIWRPLQRAAGRRWLVRALVAVGAICALATLALIVSIVWQVAHDNSWNESLPSDAAMIRSFEAHKPQYEELLQIFLANERLSYDAMPERYRSLLDQLGVQYVERSGKHEVNFIVSTVGLAPSGGMKGYVFADRPPKPLVGDTDRAAARRDWVYRRIDGGWYLFREGGL